LRLRVSVPSAATGWEFVIHSLSNIANVEPASTARSLSHEAGSVFNIYWTKVPSRLDSAMGLAPRAVQTR